MSEQMEMLGAVDHDVVEGEDYTVMSLCDRLALAEDASGYVAECCAPCPSFTTVPCSC